MSREKEKPSGKELMLKSSFTISTRPEPLEVVVWKTPPENAPFPCSEP